MTDSYPTLGFDPAPGTVPHVEAAAADLQQVAQRMGSARESLIRIGRDGGLWVGAAADTFRNTVDELPKYLDQAHRSLGDAAKTLTQWSQELGSMQQKARDHEARAVAAQRRVNEAESNPDLRLTNQEFPDDASLQQAEKKLNAAQGELSSATDELEQIREQAKRLQAQHDELARQVQNALDRATNEVPSGPSLLSMLEHALSDLGREASELADKTWNWVQAHSADINRVGDVLTATGTALSVVAVATAWIPGVDAVTASAAIGVNAAAFGAHALARAGGAETPWSTIGMDAVGAIPGGKAVAVGKKAFAQAGQSVARDALQLQNSGKIAKFYNKSVEALTGSKTVTTPDGEKLSPSTFKEILNNSPSETVKKSAEYAHVKSAQTLNSIPGINLDPYSSAGLATGATIAAAEGYGIHEGMKHATSQLGQGDQNQP